MTRKTLTVLLQFSFLHLNAYYMVPLQPTDARRALPCWDEPLLKATFSVTLVSRNGTVNLSNMPARSNVAVADALTEALFEGVSDGSWHATSFETTPPVSIERDKALDQLMIEQMSTYLLAFANGEFVHLESSYKSPLSGRVRPLRIYSMAFAFDWLLPR